MTDPRHIGRVKHVLGATVTVELDEDLAGTSPIVAGRLQAIGQVGSIVRIPQGPVSLLASVTLVGIAELTRPLTPAQNSDVGNRWLQVQLLGEVTPLGEFRRGVSTYPALDDPVFLVLAEELLAVFPPAGGHRVRLGHIVASGGVEIAVDAAALVMRHGAIVGSTGSGKSSSVSLLVQRMAAAWPAANIVIVDPHGEYGPALENLASVRKVAAEKDADRLHVPYWALPAHDLLTVLSGRIEGANTTPRFAELVAQSRRTFAEKAKWVSMPPEAIGPDTPIPFDIRQVWFKLDSENRATVSVKNDESTEQVETLGVPRTLTSNVYKPYGMGSAAPFQGPRWQHYGTTPDRIRLKLKDPRLSFLLAPLDEEATNADPLPGLGSDWLGGDRPVSVLDFSGVPSEASDLAIGLIVRMLFEIALRSREDGIGRSRPVYIVLEEAHRYLGEAATVRMAREAVNRVAREGRKHGVGLLLVTQRPSELPETALSQVGTIIALRLTNGGDQSTVRAALPDSVSGLADALPSLRTGEAILSGESVPLPVRVVIDRPDPEPRASDPTLEGWAPPARRNDVTAAVERWRAEEGA